MDRQQKIEQIRSRSGRVSRVSNLEVNPKYMHPDYISEHCDGILSETGRLEVLKLLSSCGNGPHFVARWDQGPEDLDIDMLNAPKSAIQKFKNNRNGYSGHHTNRSTDPNKRIFEVKIETPQGVIFEGEVSFSNTYELIASMKAEGAATCDAQVIRSGLGLK